MIQRILLLLLFFYSAFAFAADRSAYTDAFRVGANEYQVWGGYSPDSLTWIGKSEARRLFMAGAGWRRVMLATDRFAWKFTVDIVPVALVSQPTLNGKETVQALPNVQAFTAACQAAGITICPTFGRRTTYGAGFAPVGFEFNFRRKRRVQPVADINAGLLRFTREVPIANSAAINFTFSWGAGLQIFTSESRSVTVGYRFHHISNANSGTPFNPGIDSNFLYLGYSFHK
jgi:opacity protein-like surface antigen